jgi:hypothetical protein
VVAPVYFGEAMFFFAEMARSEKDLDKRGEYYTAASNIAVRLAPFRYRTYSVKVAADRVSPLEALEGKTSQQGMAELVELITATGVLPQRLAAMMNGGGVINVSPEKTSTPKMPVSSCETVRDSPVRCLDGR